LSTQNAQMVYKSPNIPIFSISDYLEIQSHFSSFIFNNFLNSRFFPTRAFLLSWMCRNDHVMSQTSDGLINLKTDLGFQDI